MNKVPLEYLKELLKGIGERYWFEFDAIGIEEDYFHIVVGASPKNSPSDIMRTIKSINCKDDF